MKKETRNNIRYLLWNGGILLILFVGQRFDMMKVSDVIIRIIIISEIVILSFGILGVLAYKHIEDKTATTKMINSTKYKPRMILELVYPFIAYSWGYEKITYLMITASSILCVYIWVCISKKKELETEAQND